MKRRSVVLGALAGLWNASAFAHVAGGADAPRLRRREDLLRAAESLLARADPAAALLRFEEAAGMLHSADTEMGIVRSHMQAGDYRLALAFAAHTAGVHLEEGSGIALHAWLLHAGGHEPVARRHLAAALERPGAGTMLGEVAAQLRKPWPVPPAGLLRAPARFAPYASAAPLAEFAGSATLLPGGARAVGPLSARRPRARYWLRNGLGRTVAARMVRTHADLGIAEWEVSEPLELLAGSGFARRPPYAGSGVYAVAYAPNPRGEAAWPLLKPGFLASPAGGTEWLALGIPIAPAGATGPVFDVQGRLAGIVVRRSGASVLLGAALLEGLADMGEPADAASRERLSVEAVYEIALRQSLQLLRA